jgi:hypothetical protein
MQMSKKKFRFDFAISCAGAQQEIARALRDALVEKGFKVFFYKDFEHEVFGEDGKKFFKKVYSEESRYCIVLISKEYNKRKWTKLERRIIEAREIKNEDEVLLPVLTSNYKPRWLLSSLIYFNLKKRSLEELVKLLEKKIRIRWWNYKKRRVKKENNESASQVKRIPRRPVKCDDYKWNKLVQLIKNQSVIPVIGQGLYTIETKKEENRLLYDFLAWEVARKIGISFNHTFTDACAEFLEQKKGKKLDCELESVLTEALKGIRLSPSNPLWKLIRCQYFNIFFTTAYDNLLSSCIEKVKKLPVEVLSYTLTESKLELPNEELLDNIKNSRCSLVCHILGKLGKNIIPAYTITDIQSTLHQLLHYIRDAYKNILFRELKNRCFLFLGFKPEDRVLQSFIPGFANWLSRANRDTSTRLFIGGIRGFNESKTIDKLLEHLRTDEIEVIDFMESGDFIDCLCQKLEQTPGPKIDETGALTV